MNIRQVARNHPGTTLLCSVAFAGAIVAGVVTSSGGGSGHMTAGQAAAAIRRFAVDVKASDCDQLQADVTDASRHPLKWGSEQFVDDETVAWHWKAGVALIERAAEECQSGDRASYRQLLASATTEFNAMNDAADPGKGRRAG